MQNLAGSDRADKIIEQELNRSHISIVRHDELRGGEVPTHFTGELSREGETAFEFERAWYYWMVSGNVPLAVAQELYDDPVGRTDVRVVGHCGCPPPEKWERNGFIDSYHIDSEVGLRFFVDTLRRHELVD